MDRCMLASVDRVSVMTNWSLICLNASLAHGDSNGSDTQSYDRAFHQVGENIRSIMPLLNEISPTAQPESVLSCLEELSGSGMGRTLELFWNTSFTLMIVTALIGNSAVLWIVISTSYISTTRFTLTVSVQITGRCGP